MQDHINDHYENALEPPQMSIALDLCSRSASETTVDVCVLCGKELMLLELQKHVAAHMQDIALFVLPTTTEEDEEGSLASGEAANLKSSDASDESGASGTNTPRNVDSVEDASADTVISPQKSLNQNPAAFTSLISQKCDIYEAKIAQWNSYYHMTCAAVGYDQLGTCPDDETIPWYCQLRMSPARAIPARGRIASSGLLMGRIPSATHTVMVPAAW